MKTRRFRSLFYLKKKIVIIVKINVLSQRHFTKNSLYRVRSKRLRILAGSTQSKQWRIELLYRYKRVKTSRKTVLNIRKLYLYFVYFKLYIYFVYFVYFVYIDYFVYFVYFVYFFYFVYFVYFKLYLYFVYFKLYL